MIFATVPMNGKAIKYFWATWLCVQPYWKTHLYRCVILVLDLRISMLHECYVMTEHCWHGNLMFNGLNCSYQNRETKHVYWWVDGNSVQMPPSVLVLKCWNANIKYFLVAKWRPAIKSSLYKLNFNKNKRSFPFTVKHKTFWFSLCFRKLSHTYQL